jgi:hypothetical protein
MTEIDSRKKAYLQKLTSKIYHTLLKPDRWFTGTPIKAWVQASLFLPELSLELNPNLRTNRWSAYVHFNYLVSFKNLLEKAHLPTNSVAVLHPLLPAEMVDVILQASIQPIFLDINKSSLQLNYTDFEALSKQIELDLLVLVCPNGVTEDIKKILNLCYVLHIKVFLFLDYDFLSVNILQIMVNPAMTAVIFKSRAWFPKIVSEIAPKAEVIQSENWFISWFLEDRIVSSNEIHLSQSQLAFGGFLEKMHFLELQKLQKLDFKVLFMSIFYRTFIYKNKIANDFRSVELDLASHWKSIQNQALPDFIFEVEEAYDSTSSLQKMEFSVSKWQKLQQHSKSYYDFLISEIPKQPVSSLEVPIFYLDQVYFYYHFFTTESVFWLNLFSQKGLKIINKPDVHNLVSSQLKSLPNTELFLKYGFMIAVES